MWRYSKKLLLIMLSCFYLQNVYAENAASTLTNLLMSIQTLQADFSQTVKNKTNILQESQGHMALKRPGKFRWEVTQPIAQLIIANGNHLWIYDADLQQVTLRAFSKAAGQTPALLLSTPDMTLNRDFTIASVPQTAQIAGIQEFVLTPKKADDSFATIKIVFIHRHIQKMQLEDQLGHLTTMVFRNVKTDVPLADTLFEFKPPPNVDVIDETKSSRK